MESPGVNMRGTVQFLVNTVGPIAAIAVMVIGFKALMAGRELPERNSPPNRGMLVEVETAEATTLAMTVSANGAVVPARRVVIQPEVSGVVTELADSLVQGGFVSEGERLVRIYGRDYSLAVDQADASVRQAETALEIERGRQRVAEREWEMYEGQLSDVPEGGLAVREPQVRGAEIAVELAETQLQVARLRASRTRIEAPFDGVVLNENAELGQLVGPSSQLATLVATDEFWIEVAVPMSTLNAIRIPGVNAERGSRATVTHRVGSNSLEREGRIDRLLGDLTPVGNLARLIVVVEDPFDLGRPVTERRLPLLLGSYVDVGIEGEEAHDVIEIPRAVLHDGDRLYVAADGSLSIRRVEIAWRNDTSVFVTDGITPGERYITSPIPVAVDGMTIRVAGEQEQRGEPDA